MMHRRLDSITPFNAAVQLAAFFLLMVCNLAAGPTSAPYSPAEAASHFTLPPGFVATLFAGEPDVVQPIATVIDDRGRLWVAECLSYPNWQMHGEAGPDRIIIFEDQRGDGHFSKRTVFAEHLSNVSGLEIGFGGVWICSSPNLLFIPTDNSGDKPAGPARVVLDGWNIKDAKHNVFNRLTWGPDGWLYGCNGIGSKSLVGLPGTADAKRIAFNCGVWRYHPTHHIFEVVANGTTNPWGLDFDDEGQIFITNCVIEHLWYIIPGGHYKRMFGEDFNPNLYGLMQTCSDHIHWAGGDWTTSRTGEANSAAGGGHAHAGCMIYLGDNWPDQYRNTVFMCNIHGNRVNNDILQHQGSGYVARHGKDFLLANDSWFRGLNLIYGPDGGVYINDWCDTGECHNYQVVDRTNGRIYKVTYGNPAAVQVNLAGMSDRELVELQLRKNDWFCRHARRILQERAASGTLDATTAPLLKKMLAEQTESSRKLRALWALYSIDAVDGELLKSLLASPEPIVRAWAIRLSVDDPSKPIPLPLAGQDSSPMVRLALASASQRLPSDVATPLLLQLASHARDTTDANLPLMDWYGIEHVAESNLDLPARIISEAKIPLLREYAARFLASHDLARTVQVLKATDDPQIQVQMLRAIQTALSSQRQVDPPGQWWPVASKLIDSPHSEIRLRALLLSLTFGEPSAEVGVRMVVTDTKASVSDRREALSALVQAKGGELGEFLQRLLDDRDLREVAIHALAEGNDPATPGDLIEHFQSFNAEQKRGAIATLSSRRDWALQMLQAVGDGKLARGDLDALTIRQLGQLGDPQIDATVKKVWGTIRPASADRVQLLPKYKAELTPQALAKADLSKGRAIFNRTCSQCHTLFDSGGNVGPNLTGSQRSNLDYLLENILDPSAIVAKEYEMTTMKTTDGRVVSGVIEKDDANGLTLRMPGLSEMIPAREIKSRKTEAISMMPEGLLQGLSLEERRDLMGYLQSDRQVELPGLGK
jgi:putative membrane-bound dehydrogenase-like protein